MMVTICYAKKTQGHHSYEGSVPVINNLSYGYISNTTFELCHGQKIAQTFERHRRVLNYFHPCVVQQSF